ncbi:MAG TPA: hypothetical protein VJ957_04835 [Longimicrobiales bacterium]|nr:hypothetical protein [Longimicrobiales bacterium]
MPDARMHPALLERLAELAGDITPAEASAAVHARGPQDLPAVMRYIIERRRAQGTVPREIPISNRRTAPEWLFNLAGQPPPDARRAARWPASLLQSPLEREPNPFTRFYLAVACRASATLGLPTSGWRWFIQLVRLVLLGFMVWLSAHGAGTGLAVLVALVAGGWMLLATPHVADRVGAAIAVATFNDALEAALAEDEPPDESLSPPSVRP